MDKEKMPIDFVRHRRRGEGSCYYRSNERLLLTSCNAIQAQQCCLSIKAGYQTATGQGVAVCAASMHYFLFCLRTTCLRYASPRVEAELAIGTAHRSLMLFSSFGRPLHFLFRCTAAYMHEDSWSLDLDLQHLENR